MSEESGIIEWGWAGSALEFESGDLHFVVTFPGGALVALLDGLGHGPEAAAAAAAAVPILESCASDPPLTILQRCHDGLRKTRGVAMSLASFDSRTSSMTWTGVGNVEGILLRVNGRPGYPSDAIALRGGVVGYRLPPLHANTLQVSSGDTLIMATDGIKSGFTAGFAIEHGPQEVACRVHPRSLCEGNRRRACCGRPLSEKRSMNELLKNFAQEYTGALEAYLVAGDESALSHAYELGRRAMVEGLGVLDVAAVHHMGLETLVLSTQATDPSRLASAAADFFRELLSPFEMSFRCYRGANEQLQRLNETLREQKEAVEYANRELESFSYSVSHDLRSPLLSIDGFSHILLEDYSDALNDEGKKYLLNICEAAKRMSVLIDDLLSLARVKLTEIQHANVDLTALARGIAVRLQAKSPERLGDFIITDGMHAIGDRGLLSVLLENLLSNAWKFSSKRPRAEITFDCERRDGQTTYFVRDNGAGFDMAYAGKLFSTFQRLHAASEFEGTGIGLAIVQRVIQRHEGRIWAEGKIGVGATFYFTLGGGHNP